MTRDRIYADVEWRGRLMTFIDTGGIDPNTSDILLSQMREQAMIAIETCDLIIFLVDVRAGMTADDEDVAQLLRRSAKKTLLVANKADSVVIARDAVDFLQLGLGDPIPVSSTNMMGLGDLLDAVLDRLPPDSAPRVDEDAEKETVINIAVVGKPNVGKSSLVNKLLGQNRTMVSDIPGTTRDAIDAEFTANGQAYRIIDTAGIRRKRAVEDGTLERYSVIRAIAAISRCDVCLLVIDATESITEQDAKIAGLTLDEGKALVVVINKWDLLEKETGTLEKFDKIVRENLKFASYMKSVYVSAKTGQRTGEILATVLDAYTQATKRIKTGALNDCLADAQVTMQPPASGGRRLKLYYATQASVQPPTFIFFVNEEKLMHFAYERYLENQLRKTFGFSGTPIRMIFRNRKKEA
ncbi:GTPase Der [Clostridia bacterium]|nr:GTPase Der [Clostridia bacterium]